MTDFITKRLDEMLDLVVKAKTGPCGCASGCEHCGQTGITIPSPNSAVVASEVLVACVFAMDGFRQQGDPESVRKVLRWAARYIRPSLEGVDLDASAGLLRAKAREGEALIENAKSGPTESLTTDELKKKLLDF